MREYHCRGKRINNGEWVYGWYAKCFRPFHADADVIITKKGETVEIYPETAGQHTGLKDKNGRGVYEGDIVRYGDTIHKIVFEQRNNTAYFGLVYSPLETLPFGHYQDFRQIEVIGTIYDNPELLKEGSI